jgi:hypothetical protein
VRFSFIIAIHLQTQSQSKKQINKHDFLMQRAIVYDYEYPVESADIADFLEVCFHGINLLNFFL